MLLCGTAVDRTRDKPAGGEAAWVAVSPLSSWPSCRGMIGTAGTEDGLAPISALCAHNLGADLPLLRRGGTVVAIGNKGMTESNKHQ